jgi:hypothetical protein
MTENKKPNGSDEDEFLFVQAPQNVQALYEAIAKKYVKYAADCISDITPQTGDFAVFRCAVAGLKVEKGRLTDFGKATLEGPLSAKDIAAERKMCPSLNMYMEAPTKTFAYVHITFEINGATAGGTSCLFCVWNQKKQKPAGT